MADVAVPVETLADVAVAAVGVPADHPQAGVPGPPGRRRADPDAGSDVPLDAGTASLVGGLSAIRDPEQQALARRLGAAIDRRAKRVLNTWAPCADWSLLDTGRSEGIVPVHPDGYGQAPGELLAADTHVAYRAADRMWSAPATRPRSRRTVRRCLLGRSNR